LVIRGFTGKAIKYCKQRSNAWGVGMSTVDALQLLIEKQVSRIWQADLTF